jgi:hypothetical protein
MRFIGLFIPFLLSLNVAANSITLYINSPQVNSLSNSTLYVAVYVNSSYQISDVNASVSGRDTSLLLDPLGIYHRENLVLSGLPEGDTLTLVVTVTDVFNNSLQDSVDFIYVNPPILNIDLPIPYTNVYSAPIRIKANSSGASDISLRVTVTLGSVVYDQTFTNSVDTILFIQDNTATGGEVYYYAKDNWNQVSQSGRFIIYEDNPYFLKIYEGNKRVYDFNFNKVLEIAANQGYITDVTTLQSIPISNNSIDDNEGKVLTPFGALYKTHSLNPVCDWNNDSLYNLAGSEAFSYKGQYATWTKDSTNNYISIYLRDLSNRTDHYVYTLYDNYVASRNDVGTNGVVVFTTGSGIWKYFNGVKTSLTSGSNLEYGDPITDGKYFVYYSRGTQWPDIGYYKLLFHNDTSESLLCDYGYVDNDRPEWQTDYQIRNRFVAFAKPGAGGIRNIWLRDTTGIITQASFFGSDCTIEELNYKGDMMCLNGGKRYLIRKGIMFPQDLGIAVGSVAFRDSAWYLVSGLCAYRIMVNAFFTASDGNWTNPATWAGGIVPPADADVVILNNVTVNTNVTCNTLSVHQPASVNVLPGVTLTVLH